MGESDGSTMVHPVRITCGVTYAESQALSRWRALAVGESTLSGLGGSQVGLGWRKIGAGSQGPKRSEYSRQAFQPIVGDAGLFTVHHGNTPKPEWGMLLCVDSVFEHDLIDSPTGFIGPCEQKSGMGG